LADFIERSVKVVVDFAVGNGEAERFWMGFGLRPMTLSAGTGTDLFATRVRERRKSQQVLSDPVLRKIPIPMVDERAVRSSELE
jgi:hypothetical protein